MIGPIWHTWVPRFLLGLALISGPAGCKLETIPEVKEDMGLEDPPLDPRSIFEMQARPDLVANCQGCHRIQQDTTKPFLEEGKEYESITAYEEQRFLTTDPDQSILLTKGMHMGPALTSQQYDHVRAWLAVEAAVRGNKAMPALTTPSVAMRPGEFFISLEGLVKDPLAKLTFKVEAREAGTFRVTDIALSAGPLGGIRIKNPVFLLFSTGGVRRDRADTLSGLELTVTASQRMPLVAGSVLLTRVPMPARIAMAFEIISAVDPKPIETLKCKSFDAFNSSVRPVLQAPCGTICHAMGATDPRAAQALGAFDMTLARSQVAAEQQLFCVRSLSRVNLADPAKSVLVLQATPPEQGGTSNHPYKLSSYMTFTQAVQKWAAGEK